MYFIVSFFIHLWSIFFEKNYKGHNFSLIQKTLTKVDITRVKPRFMAVNGTFIKNAKPLLLGIYIMSSHQIKA